MHLVVALKTAHDMRNFYCCFFLTSFLQKQDTLDDLFKLVCRSKALLPKLDQDIVKGTGGSRHLLSFSSPSSLFISPLLSTGLALLSVAFFRLRLLLFLGFFL